MKTTIQNAIGNWLPAAGKNFGLPTSGFRLLSSVFGLRSSDFGLRTSVFRLSRLLPSIRFATQGAVRTSVFGLLFLLLFTACEDVIEVKLSDENLNLLGVEASITTQNQPTVFLYQTLQVDQDRAYPGISGAVVTVSDNASPANSVTLVEDAQRKGFYKVPQNTSYLGVAGREYTLKIQTGGVTLTAKDKLTKVEPIDSMKVFPSLRGDKLFLGVFTYGKEPKGVGNFYKWDVLVNDSVITNKEHLAIASDEFVDGNYITQLEIYTDFHDIKKPEDRTINLHDTVVVRQTSISEFGYNFYFQMINQSSTGGLFSVPPANIKSNFTSSDGKPVLGLFIARDIATSNAVVIDEKIESLLKKR